MTSQWNGAAGWPRPRGVRITTPVRTISAPSCFVQERAGDPLSASKERLAVCFHEFVCQVCGESVLEVDSVGWVLKPVANMGGACCTRCMYLALRSCPHLADAPSGAWELWAVRAKLAYTWNVAADGTADGHVVVTGEDGTCHDWEAFMCHYRAWKTQPRQWSNSSLASEE